MNNQPEPNERIRVALGYARGSLIVLPIVDSDIEATQQPLCPNCLLPFTPPACQVCAPIPESAA